MSNILSRSLQSVFLAATLVFSPVGAGAQLLLPGDNSGGSQNAPNQDGADASNKSAKDSGITIKVEPAQKEESDKPIYKMTFKELLKENDGDYKKAWEIYEFYQLRQLHLDVRVDKDVVDKLIAQIDVLDTIAPGKEIKIVINSSGGGVVEGLRLYNKFKSSKSPIHTHVEGEALSMAAYLLIGGDIRTATPASRIMIHEVAGGVRNKTEDAVHDLNHTMSLQDDLFGIVAKNSGLSLDDVAKLAARDVYYSAHEALRLGFIDRIEEGKPERDIEPGSRKVPDELYPENRVRPFYDARSRPTP